MVAVINAPSDGSGSFLDYQSAAELVASVGLLPSVVMGGQFITSYPTGPPTGPFPALATTASTRSGIVCTAASSKTSNTSATGTLPVFTSGVRSVYSSVPFTNHKLPSLMWQVAFGLGVITTVFLARLIT